MSHYLVKTEQLEGFAQVIKETYHFGNLIGVRHDCSNCEMFKFLKLIVKTGGTPPYYCSDGLDVIFLEIPKDKLNKKYHNEEKISKMLKNRNLRNDDDGNFQDNNFYYFRVEPICKKDCGLDAFIRECDDKKRKNETNQFLTLISLFSRDIGLLS